MKDLYFISPAGKAYRICLSCISYVSISSGSVSVFLKEKEIVLSGQAASLVLDHLQSPLFVKVNRSTVVSVSSILSIREKNVIAEGKKFSLEKTFKPEVVSVFREKTERDFNEWMRSNSGLSYELALTV